MQSDNLLEQTVIGHALNNEEHFKRFCQLVEYKDFDAPAHKAIAYCLKWMANLGITNPDEDSFQLAIKSFPEEDKNYGSAEYIRNLKEQFKEPTDNYGEFLSKFKIYALKNFLGKDKLEDLLKVLNNPSSSPTDIQTVLRDAIQDVERYSPNDNNFMSAEDLEDKYLAEINDRVTRKFYSCGFPELDQHLTHGFAPKKVTILAGYTGMAKSTVSVGMAQRIAAQGRCAAIFSLESPAVDLYDKLVSSYTYIPLLRLIRDTKSLTAEEHERIDGAIKIIRTLPIIINDQPSISIDGMENQILSVRRAGYNPEVVFVDLFGKVDDVDTGDNLPAKIQKNCKRMRVLANELDVHFVLVLQMGRSSVGRTKDGILKRPSLTGIKNSNAYAEEADSVMLLFREKYFKPELDDDILEIILAKQRGGIAGITSYFELNAETSTIVETRKRPDGQEDEDE